MNQYCSNCGTRLNGEAFCPRCQRPVAQATPDNNHAPTPPTPSPGRMTFGGAVKTCFKKYAAFDGRASRAECWNWFWFGFALSMLAWFLTDGKLNPILNLALFMPGLAVTVRRLHDVGKSGWNYLWCLTVIGAFYVLYLVLQPTNTADNEYGAPAEVC
ncbi:MAG: DUF805 domain-containing protein [Kiritimatiellae bacterium]|nr:DUF805 domain-containing protein [Kiritimatiellia bacterium]